MRKFHVAAVAISAALGGSAALVSLTAGAAPSPGGVPRVEAPVSEPGTSPDPGTEIETALEGSEAAPDQQVVNETEKPDAAEQADTETDKAETPEVDVPEVDHHDAGDHAPTPLPGGATTEHESGDTATGGTGRGGGD